MTGWHVPDDLLRGYLEGRIDPPRAMSVEAHLVGCVQCRAAVPVDESWLAASWDGVQERVAPPRRSPVERLLGRVVPEHVARLLLATPALSRAWLLAVVLVLAFAVAAARLSDGSPVALLLFLVIAPVLPLGGISVAYGPAVDTAYELHAATPLAGVRLLLVRAGAVLVAATLLTGVAAPFLAGPLGLSAAWLLPALMLTVASLAAGTRVPIPVAAAGLAALWVGAVLATQSLGRFLLFQPVVQLGYGAAAVVCGAVLYARRRRLDPGERM
ncbi:zf-HC2 domain-containing protein [Actinocrispum wychmicini]|uniref:Putative zinc finger protein n=1 Tax=Actinocrispum wychmicini TaxID=1213861 RepID=A0A4R2JL43_9PSEU|nr:zf-HC2 domain-containing protein [Actinocrispum wychmicini]TCO60741.1 putative zinc finger protein [Actinocrispum wychmicini]